MSFLNMFLPKPRLSEEAFFAYYHRLPKSIRVTWRRKGKYIVGEVKGGGKKFITQGKNANDFINMVNESLIVCNDIPHEYIEILSNFIKFVPKPREKKALKNASVSNGTFGIVKINEKSLVYNS